MSRSILQDIIEAAWEDRAALTSPDQASYPLREAVAEIITALDDGTLRVAHKVSGQWEVQQWVKKAILLSFRLSESRPMGQAPLKFYDKVPLKFENHDQAAFEQAGFRVVPGATVRRGAYIGRDVVLMPSYVNIGAYVGEGSMIDTWATVGSCAQIG